VVRVKSHGTSAIQSACLALELMDQSMDTIAFCTNAMKPSSGRYHIGSCWKVEPNLETLEEADRLACLDKGATVDSHLAMLRGAWGTCQYRGDLRARGSRSAELT